MIQLSWFKQRFKYPKYIVNIELNTTQINYIVVYFTIFKCPIIIQKDSVSYNEIYETEQILTSVLTKLTAIVPKHSCYRLLIDKNWVMQKTLPLPEIKLSHQELTLWVASSLNKLFQLNAKSLFFDFIEQDNMLHIVACQHDKLNPWLEQFNQQQLHLTFAGISNTDFDDFSLQQKPALNLLPWRQQYQQNLRLKLSLLICSYLSIAFLGLFLLWEKETAQLLINQQQIIQQQNIEQRLRSHLDEGIKINKQIIKLKQQIEYYEIIKQKQYQLQQRLLRLSQLIPDAIWLDKLSYDDQHMEIDGQSFLYTSIVSFTERWSAEQGVKYSELQQITPNTHLLSFKLKLTFDLETP